MIFLFCFMWDACQSFNSSSHPLYYSTPRSLPRKNIIYLRSYALMPQALRVSDICAEYLSFGIASFAKTKWLELCVLSEGGLCAHYLSKLDCQHFHKADNLRAHFHRLLALIVVPLKQFLIKRRAAPCCWLQLLESLALHYNPLALHF